MATPSSLELSPHFLPLLGLMTSRYRGENAVPFSLKGVGIAPTVELSVVIGMNVPLLSFPRFHGFGQTNRTSWFAMAREGEEVTLCVAPFFHAYGLTVGMNFSMLAAAAMVLLPRFKAKDVVKAIRRYHPTLFPGIPTMYLAIMRETSRHPEYLESIKYCISGAAPLPAKVQADFEAITHGKLVEGYGLSEAAPVTHCNPLTNECRNGSIGIPLPNVDAAIVHQETGEPVSPGELGELVVKGPNVMQGYWKREEETRSTFRNGWLRTGDLGRMDEDGYFSIVERSKDVIITGGFKVYPREVEEVLLQHPVVAEAAVAGVPDAYRGETVAAFIMLEAGVEASEKTRQELLQYCEQDLTAYKVPKILEFRKSLPKSLIGKVIRRELLEGSGDRQESLGGYLSPGQGPHT